MLHHSFLPSFDKLLRSLLFGCLFVFVLTSAEARIIRLIVDRVESPAFNGQSFGEVGQYEKIIGRAIGEVDPYHPLNAVITDLQLVPRNGQRYVRYETTFYILKPMISARGSGLLWWSAPNRGDKRLFTSLNQGIGGSNDPTNPGDGLAMRRGYTIVWSGWQPDVQPGNGRMTISTPVASSQEGTELRGLVRMELIPAAPMNSWAFALYPPVEAEAARATLTLRQKEADPRVVVPASQWAYGNCSSTPFPGVASKSNLCLRGSFQPDGIYEFIYEAKDPLVLGLGLAATRDLVSFLRFAQTDDTGTVNPLANQIVAAIGEGQSQAGRYLRSYLDLGFNRDEFYNTVFDGMNAHIASQGVPLNVRFGQPDRSMGQRENASYPAPEGALTWSPVLDPLAGRIASNMDICLASLSCPKIMVTTSGTEFWQGRMSLNLTNWNGTKDVEPIDLVRIYHFSSTQHTPTTSNNLGSCQLIQNPAPFFETRRALLVALEQWVLNGKEPPPSRYPQIADASLVRSDANSLGWPKIPGVKFPLLIGELTLRDFGSQFDGRHVSGITLTEPPVLGAAYQVLAPKVDADGNEIGGIRSTTVEAPSGTYVGWALRRAGFGEDELCGLTGSYIPFRATKAERLTAADPRLSMEERYPAKDSQALAVEAAANALVKQGYLLPEDAARLILAAKQ